MSANQTGPSYAHRRDPNPGGPQMLPSIAIGRLILAVAFVLAMAAFVFRPIPLTTDDPFYIHYFLYDRPLQRGLFRAVIDEPAFAMYTTILGRMFDPITNVRLMILLGLAPHAIYALTLPPRRGWLYFIGYFGFVELAVHLSWVQLRQGMVLGLLLLGIHFLNEKRGAIYSALLGVMHTAMLVVAPCFAVPLIPNRRLAYAAIIAVAVVLTLFPGTLYQFTYYFGRREAVYLYAEATTSPMYIAYSLALIGYVTLFLRDDVNADRMLAYHAMCAVFLPMFLIPTYGAFAERFYSIVKWYELFIVVSSRAPRAFTFGLGYLGINLSYSVYHSFRYWDQGGYWDRIESLFGP